MGPRETETFLFQRSKYSKVAEEISGWEDFPFSKLAQTYLKQTGVD